jgi:ATP:corrinoid adenosyltransferase
VPRNPLQNKYFFFILGSKIFFLSQTAGLPPKNQRRNSMTNIYVIDAPCGAGKTSGAINMINNDSNNNKYLFITPFLKEVERIKEQCNDKGFFEPQEIGTKLNGIHWLINNEKNIVSTHALFLNFNEKTMDLLRQKQYILILDEVVDVVKIIEISKKDLESILDRYAHIEDGLMIWDDEDYTGKFNDIMRMALNKCVGIYKNAALVWCFPIEVFKLFKEVYILTYMFDAQIQKYYYDFYKLDYDYKYVTTDYYFTDDPQNYFDLCKDYQRLVNVLQNEKMNLIGDSENALSVSWFERDGKSDGAKQALSNMLKSNLENYFKNIRKSSSDSNMWTTFKEYKKILQGGGYTRGFVSVNARATNDYGHKTNLAYCANIFMNPILKQFFQQREDVKVSEGMYGLSELVQWTWRSAIRNNKLIHIYIPSSRMRGLFKNWLEEVSNGKISSF